MSNLNVSNATVSSYIVTTEMWIQYVVFYVFLGAVSVVENIQLIIIIIKDKKMRTFFYVILCGHCFGQILYALGQITVGLYRVLPVVEPNILYIPRWGCHTLNLGVYFCPSFSAATLLLLAGDRSFALAKPLSYNNKTAKHGLILLTGTFLITLLIKIGPSYAGPVPFTQTVTCTSAVAGVTVPWNLYNYSSNLAMIILSVCMYLSIFVFAFIRARSLSNGTFSNDDLANRLLKRQLKFLNTIRLLVALNIIIVLPYGILLVVAPLFDPKVAPRLVAYGGCFNILDMVFEPILLFAKSTELRQNFANQFKKYPTFSKSNSVGTVQSTV